MSCYPAQTDGAGPDADCRRLLSADGCRAKQMSKSDGFLAFLQKTAAHHYIHHLRQLALVSALALGNNE